MDTAKKIIKVIIIVVEAIDTIGKIARARPSTAVVC